MQLTNRHITVEFRSDGDADDGLTLSGYCSVFDQPAEIRSWEGTFTETIGRSAFNKTLKNRRKPIMQFNHGRDARTGQVPIGVYTELRADEHGLHVRGRLFDNAVVEPIRQAIAGNAITGMSISFRVIRDDWTDAQGRAVTTDERDRLLFEGGSRGPLQRLVKELALHEAGPVVSPAYSGTSVGVRSSEARIIDLSVARARLQLLQKD